MKKDQAEEVLANASKAAKAYKRRVPWVEVDDLEQEAIKAQLEAAERYNPELQAFGGYMWRVAVQHLLRYVLYQSSPVTYKGGSPGWKEKLTGCQRESLDSDHSMMHLASISEDVASRRKVRQRVVDIIGTEEASFAFGVLADGWKPREVAAEHNIPVRAVYRDIEKLKCQLRADPVLRAAWSDL